MTFVYVVLAYPPLVLGVILRKGSLLYELKIQVRIAYMPICTRNKSPVKTELFFREIGKQLKKDSCVSIKFLACVQTSPLPQKKSGKETPVNRRRESCSSGYICINYYFFVFFSDS